jgi:hypothetical protein
VNGFFGRGELFKPRQIVAQNFAVKKQQSGKRLILYREVLSDDLPETEIQILNAQAQDFRKAQARAVKQISD